MRLLFALLGLLAPAPALVAGPPEGPSGQQVQDEVVTLKAEVKRLEKEVTRYEYKAEDLFEAQARLATAEGRPKTAAAAWRKLIAFREERVRVLEQAGLRPCVPADPAILPGPVAEARCGLAEVEKDRAVLARELPKVIAYHEAILAALRTTAKEGAYPPEEAERGEQAHLKKLRQARQRLDAVKQR
jgi:hypothetical protein